MFIEEIGDGEEVEWLRYVICAMRTVMKTRSSGRLRTENEKKKKKKLSTGCVMDVIA